MRIIRIGTIIIFLVSGIFFFVGKQVSSKKDVIPPVITAESQELHVAAGSDPEALMKGLTAKDDRDGDLTEEILIGNISPFETKGVSTIEYLVFDKSNNVGRFQRTVYFDGYRSPMFELTKPLTFEKNGEILLSDRLFAKDVLEGNITDKIRYTASNVIQYEEGTYDLIVEVKNSYGDVVQKTLPINIVSQNMDVERIQLETYLIYVEKDAEIYPEDYVKAIVDLNGEMDSEAELYITSEVNLKTAGTGQFRYELYKGGERVYVTHLTVVVTDEKEQ